MAKMHGYWKLIALAISCVVLGAAASVIASAGAATGNGARADAKHRVAGAALTPRRVLARSVHGDLVIATRGGFVTITLDRGVVQSVNGQQLTLVEGTKKRTYKTLTLTIPVNARVRENRHKATLADLRAGQRVVVVQAPGRTLVVARDTRGA